MKRACSVKPAGTWDPSTAVDRVALDADERYRRRIVIEGLHGTSFLLDLPHPVALRGGDGLVLEDGMMVEVVARAEPLIEISAASEGALARLAWHIGNRHTDMQLVGGKLRIRRDHVLEDMLRGLGAELAKVEAVFEPEAGAYQAGARLGPGHHHAHDHGHSHGHDD